MLNDDVLEILSRQGPGIGDNAEVWPEVLRYMKRREQGTLGFGTALRAEQDALDFQQEEEEGPDDLMTPPKKRGRPKKVSEPSTK